MSVFNQPGGMLYAVAFGARPENVEVPVIQSRAPATTDSNWPIGKTWIDNTNNAAYILTSFTTTAGVLSANWQLTASSTGEVSSVLGTTNQITVVTASNVATVSLPSAVTAPGSLATTTTLASGTTLTAGTTFTATGGASSFGGGTFTVASGTNAINISADAAATAVNLGTGAAVKTVTIGSSNTTSSTTILSGSGGIALTGATTIVGTTLINASGAAVTTIGTGGTGAVNIGNATGNTAVTGSLTASTTLTATLGAITATNGNLVLGTAGNKIISTSVASTTTAGANSFGKVTLVSGTATISTTAVTANSIIILTRQSPGSTGAAALGILSVGTVSAGVSFVINALTTADATAVATTDVSSIGWMIIN